MQEWIRVLGSRCGIGRVNLKNFHAELRKFRGIPFLVFSGVSADLFQDRKKSCLLSVPVGWPRKSMRKHSRPLSPFGHAQSTLLYLHRNAKVRERTSNTVCRWGERLGVLVHILLGPHFQCWVCLPFAGLVGEDNDVNSWRSGHLFGERSTAF